MKINLLTIYICRTIPNFHLHPTTKLKKNMYVNFQSKVKKIYNNLNVDYILIKLS